MKNQETYNKTPESEDKASSLAEKIFTDEEEALTQKAKEDKFLEDFGKTSLNKNTDSFSEAVNIQEASRQKRADEASNKIIDALLDHDKNNKKGRGEEKNNSTETNNSITVEKPGLDTGEIAKLNAFVEKRNKGFFSKLSSSAKEIMSNAYEGVYMTPGLNKTVGKMEIAYNQFWIDRKERKAGKVKDRMDALDIKNESLSAVKTEIGDAVKTLREIGLGGTSSLLTKAKEIGKSILKNENKLDKLQGKIEEKENEVKIFTNKRDAIADRLITHYEKKLSPIEGKLVVLEERRNEIELFCIASEVKIDEQKAKIKKVEDARSKIEKSYISAGFKDRQIQKNDVIRELNEQINSLYCHIQIEQAKIAARREEINEKIAKINKKAEPYRNRKNEFIRIKDSRPIDFGLKERKYTNEFKSTEATKGHPREDEGSRYYENENISNNEQESIYGQSYEGMDKISNLINNFNDLLLKEKMGDIAIDPRELFRATALREGTQITFKNFFRIVEQYYKAKKVGKDKYEKIINNLKQNEQRR